MLITSGIMSCFAVIGSLCVNTSATAEIQRSTVWSGVTAHVTGAEVTSMVDSDSIVLPYRPDMQRLCLKEKCILYRGYCGGYDQTYKCTLWYSFSEALPLRRVDVLGNKKSVLNALAALGLVRTVKIVIPLRQFSYDAATDAPPTCYQRPRCLPRAAPSRN